LVRQVVAQAMAGRKSLTRPWAGFVGQQVDDSLAEGLGLDRPEGLIIARIHPLSPFATAGLDTGDILVEIEGNPISSSTELNFRLASLGVGREVNLVYLRDGEAKFAAVTLLAPPDSPSRDVRDLSGRSPLAGLRIANINPALTEELGLGQESEGVIVLNVASSARRLGFRKGDLIEKVNGEDVISTAQLENIVLRRAGEWNVGIMRNGKRGELNFRG